MFRLCGSSKYSGAGGEETVEILQLQLVEDGRWLLTCPLVCNNRCQVVQNAENCEGPAVAVLIWVGFNSEMRHFSRSVSAH